MSDIANFKVGKAASSIESSPAFDGISSVTVFRDEDEEGELVGSSSGRNLNAVSPWITKEIGRNILARLKGFQYQPYAVQDALLDPSAEIGDAITLDKIYSGIYSLDIDFNSMMRSSAKAPSDEDINEEAPYKSPEVRKVARKFKDVTAQLLVMADQITAEVTARENDTKEIRSLLTVQAGEIAAKVSRSGGSAESFGWSLTADGWTLTSNGGTVLQADKDGLTVTGEIKATGGVIGGFTIRDGYLSTNNQEWGGTNTSGIYIGPSGIQLGKYFKVDSAGNLTAQSGRFTGTVYAGNIDYGGNAGYFDGSGLVNYSISGGKVATDAIINRHIQSGSIYPSTCNQEINDYFADVIHANKVFTGAATASSIKTWVFTLNGTEAVWIDKTKATQVLGRA